ncbi:hypothetical protein Tco_1312814 [Tanacetum coccineum]
MLLTSLRSFSPTLCMRMTDFQSVLSRNMQNLEMQFSNETLHEKDSYSELRAIKGQFEHFIHSKMFELSKYNTNAREILQDFNAYTTMEAQTFKETIIQNMDSIEQCIIERASHEQELKMTSGDETSSGIVSDEEIDKQKLEAHSSYMAKIQEVSPDESSSTSQPLEQACSFMLCDLDFEPLSLSLSSLPSCDLTSLTNMLILLHYLESFKSEFAEDSFESAVELDDVQQVFEMECVRGLNVLQTVYTYSARESFLILCVVLLEHGEKNPDVILSCLLKEQLLEPALNLTVHCCGLEFRVLNGYDQKSFDEERGLN